jgi:hypothetical protein
MISVISENQTWMERKANYIHTVALVLWVHYSERSGLTLLCATPVSSQRNMAPQYSHLCVADKLAIAITPAWLYLPMVKVTGEIKEYMKDAERNSNGELKGAGL